LQQPEFRSTSQEADCYKKLRFLTLEFSLKGGIVHTELGQIAKILPILCAKLLQRTMNVRQHNNFTHKVAQNA
jgi:hypothetical protein